MGALAPPVFGKTVNPISTRGDRLCPPQYYEPPRIFRPCDGPAWWLGGRNSCKKSHQRANLNFLFLTLCAYLFKNCPSQLLSYWEVAQPVFCSEELSCLPYKNQNKSLNLSSLAGKFKFAIYTQGFLPPSHLYYLPHGF